MIVPTIGRDGWFLLDGRCVEECPTGLTKVGVQSLWKRRCEYPFVCKGGRMFDTTLDGSLQLRDTPHGCRCTTRGGVAWDKGCQRCLFQSDGVGDVCNECRDGQLLRNGTCVSDCGPILAAYRPRLSGFGGECRVPFVCDNGVDKTSGRDCSCKRVSAGCSVCLFRVVEGGVCIE